MKNYVVASNNQKKIEEIRNMIKDAEIKSLKDIGCFEDIPETADTFEGNALLKAKHVLDNYNMSCFSDDSGLVVPALGGAPGVYSARYAGEDKDDNKNMDKLLAELKNVEDRSAYFVTVICLHSENATHYFEGRVNGTIAHEKIGDQGFGYDPVFIPENHDRTFAEMSQEEKNGMSHRGEAIRKLAEFLASN